MIYISKLTQI